MENYLFSLLISVLVISSSVSLPTNTDQPETSPTVPREFPKFDENYTFLDDSSIRETLVSHSDVDTEVDDLLKREDEQQPVKNEDVENDANEEEEDVGRKGVVEWIEDGENTEDKKFEQETEDNNTVTTEETTQKTENVDTETPENKVQETTQSSKVDVSTETSENKKMQKLEPYKDGVPVIDGSVAAILVGIFVVICIFGYTGLLLWRRSLEMKYGSREILVDKDEMMDPDDIRHFSI